MRNTLYTSAMALVLASGTAFADGPICEREITLYQNGQLVDTSTMTFYPHGCDRFQYQPMTENQVLNLGEHCSVESSASGGCDAGEEEVDGQCISTQLLEEEVTREVQSQQEVARGVFDGSEREFRVTSMDGSNTVRVRRTDGRAVELRIAGNTVLEIPAGAPGQAYFDLPAGQSFGGLKIHDAHTGEVLRNGTASTNGQIGSVTELVTSTVTTTEVSTVTSSRQMPDGAVAWTPFAQPGPRTDRCGFPGEAIQ
jgi:hypothetical protein